MKNWIVGLAAVVLAPLANATVYQYTDTNGSLGNGGSFDSLFAEYDTDTSIMTWTVDNMTRNGTDMDGFWLVTNDGPDNPKGTDGLAIFYADFNSNSLWAFAYNGQNNASSYNATEYLGNFSSGVINSGSTRGFSVDVSSIYANLSTSAPFGADLGIWFHAAFGTSTSTDSTGRLTDWDYVHQGWYDFANLETSITEPEPDPVPAPATLPLLVLGLLGLRRMRKAR